MNTKEINGVLFSVLVKNGAANLNNKKRIVNELNVFPVPDGDTGDNMSMTINSAAENQGLDNLRSIGEASDFIAKEMLLGARGNSGVILSRIFAGISKGLNSKISASVADFSKAMALGVSEAYSAVSNPVEGTMLTVIRDGVENANKKTADKIGFEDYFKNLVEAMRVAVDKTPDLLPTLKEAGVVDSGGVGLLYIFEGMSGAISGEMAHEDKTTEAAHHDKLDISLFTEDSELTFGYCTEFLIRLQNKKVNISEFSLESFIDYLNSVGDSVVAFQDGSIIKAHVHTKTPGKILTHCQSFGEFLKLKIENMTLQHNGALIKNSFNQFKTKPHKKRGIVTVASGDGIIKTFEDLGADYVIRGGQSMNPSTTDFLKAFDETNADEIFVFPNNKNIIMTAKQAAEISGRKISVVESKTIGEGYAAISMFDSSVDSSDALLSSLNEIISGVVTGEISKASRTTTVNGIHIFEGDYIGFSGKKILVDSANRSSALLKTAELLHANDFDIAILIFGDVVSGAEAQKIFSKLKDKYPRTEFFIIDGKQPIYDYILILE